MAQYCCFIEAMSHVERWYTRRPMGSNQRFAAGSYWTCWSNGAWHLSVQKHTPELRQWQARLHQLDDAAKPSGEPGGSASGDLLWLIGGTFFPPGRGMDGVPLFRGAPPLARRG